MIQLDKTSHNLQRNIQCIDDQLYVSRALTLDKDEFEKQNKELEKKNNNLKDKFKLIQARFEEA